MIFGRTTTTSSLVRSDVAAKLLKFSLVGASGLLVNTAALYLCYQWARLPLLMASILAVELAVVSNFVLNDQWTFGERGLSVVRFARFNIVSLGGLAITTVTLLLLKNVGMYFLVANLFGVGLATAWNFVLNVLWTWRLQL
jgi:putative flippase GtrA